MNAADLPDETLFESALKCSTPAERAAYLDQVCACQPELRQRIEVLLEAHEQSGEFLEPAAAERPTLKLDRAPDETPGTVIGRYKLLQKIGEGGMGVVYMAEQTEPVLRKVALKIIKLGMDTRQVVARFEAERQALALMDHPNIARVLDAGATDNGRPYFVMELVRGVPIAEYCDKNRLSAGERLELFIPVCQAIQHAHQKGIIHRDIKASNVMVTLHDGQPVPRVIDFGVAKAINQRLTEKTLFTNYAQMIGTPAYMSPEQAEMSGLDIDTRTDVYSLGVLLYELLTGSTPFDAKELLSKGYAEMQRLIAQQEPPKPSTRMSTMQNEERTVVASNRSMEASALNKVLRGDLDWIVMKCLEKDRARRYETANGLASDIQRHLNNEPVVACPPSNLYRFQKLVRRNKVAFAAGASIAAALVIGLAIALWQSIEKTRAYKQAQIEAAKSRQVAQYLKEVLQDLGPSVALVHEPAMVRGILDRASERIDRDLANQPEAAIELREALVAIYGELGLFDRMEELSRKNLELARAIFGAESLPAAMGLHQLGEARIFLYKLEEAEPFTREALRIRRKLLGNEHLDVARSLRRLGNILRHRANSQDAEAAYREGLAICSRFSGEKSLVEADLLQDLGVELRHPGQMEEAEDVSRRAVEIKRMLLGNEHQSVADALDVLALVLREEGKLPEAETLCREVLAINLKLFGKDHFRVGGALGGLGATLAKQGRLDEAESLLRQSVAIQREALGNDHVGLMWTLFPLERVLRKQGKLLDAKTTLRDAIKLFRNHAGAVHSRAQNEIAWLLATYPDPEVRDGRSAVTYAEKAVAATSRADAGYLDTLAAAYAEAGDFAKAVTVQKESMALLRTEKEKEDYASRLRLYESSSPYREPE